MKKNLIFFLAILMAALPLAAQQKLTPEKLWNFGRVSEPVLSPDGNTILYGVTTYDVTNNSGNRNLYLVPVAGGAAVNITTFPGSEWNAVWAPDGKSVYFLSAKEEGPQIWQINADGTNPRRITSVAGGINGFAFSPDMKHLLYVADVQLDKSVNEVYPDLPLADARIIDDLMYRHWDSWHDYAYSHIFVTPFNGTTIGQARDIMENERFDAPLTPDGGMEQICWSPDGSRIAYVSRKLSGRDLALSTNSDIYIYDLKSGDTKCVSTGMNGYDLNPVFSPDGKKLAWCSMKTPGFESDKKRLMVMDMADGAIKEHAADFPESVSSLVWDPVNTSLIYFIAVTHATHQVFSHDLKTGKTNRITSGVHDYTALVSNGKVKAGAKMSMSMPTEIFRIDNTKTGVKEVQLTFTNNEVSESIQWGRVEERWIGTSDGKKMLVWVIYPPFFDKTKKYPALLYCQGGPQSAVSQFFSYRWNFQMMAAHDYIVVAPNRRGLPGFGQEWNDQISQDYGGQNMLDYLAAIDSVSKDPWVDASRLGAVGASYGGFSVYWLAGNHNKRFKAFIAHCGMFNFESWYGSTEEYWFPEHDLGGAYWKNPRPKSYDFSPHRFVGKWDTPMLVIHGANDFRIPYTEGMQAFNAAQLQGIPSRFLYFPGESHFVTKPQNSILWQREFFRWLDQWLK